jgi:hypothetical protein
MGVDRWDCHHPAIPFVPHSKARRVERAIAGAVRPRTVNGPHKQNPEGVTETIACCRPVGAWVSTDDLGLKTQGSRLSSLRDWSCELGWEPTTAER